MRFAALSTLTVATALSMPPSKAAPIAFYYSAPNPSRAAAPTAAAASPSPRRPCSWSARTARSFLPHAELQASSADSNRGRAQAAYFAGYGLTNAAGGAAADRVGGAKVLALCLVVWSSLVALTPAAASLGVTALALCRFGFGVASGPALPASLAVVSSQPDADSRAKGIATVLCGFNVGSAAGLLSAAALLTLLGWRTLSVVAGGLGGRVSIRADADHRTNHNCANNKKTGQIRQELPIPTCSFNPRPQLY